MAGASMNDIKSRIKSVNTTMQITKAMELVATSKLRRAKERAESTRSYCHVLKECIGSVISCIPDNDSVYIANRDGGCTLYIVIAGDRGLAGGYNSNIHRLTDSLSNGEGLFIPIGKVALEFSRHRERDMYYDG
jgi:F-type H+-transporting ATPase subunit gamma